MAKESMEWSMGNGQCPFCYGLGPVFSDRNFCTAKEIGHESDCELAQLMKDAGKSPAMKGGK